MSKSAIIIEDKMACIHTLQNLLKSHCPEVKVLGYAQGVESAKKLIEEKSPNLIFLDIDIKGGTGFDLLEQLPQRPDFHVIFVTVHHKFAIKAFRMCALDYLLKPINPAELQEAVKKAVEASDPYMESKLETLKNYRSGPPRMILPSGDEFFVVDISDIIRCEAKENYTMFFMKQGKQLLVTKTLKEFDDMLSNMNFFRVHRSHLVNLEYVERYSPRDSWVIMNDGSVAEVSRRRREDFLKVLKKLFNR